MMKKNCMMIAAGGTGGHIFPALSVAERLRDQGVEVIWLGSPGRMEEKIVPNYHFPIEYVDIGALRGKDFKTLCAAPFNIVKATFQVKKLIKQYQPKVILGMGGYVTGPAGVAAKISNIPFIIHEQNAFAGFTNKLLQYVSTTTFAAYDHALSGTAVKVIGNPVRESLSTMQPPKERFANRSGPLRLLVLGGSQGATAINAVILEVMQLVKSSGLPVELIQQTGSHEYEKYWQAYQKMPGFLDHHTVTAFIDDMDFAYNWADFVIARAGAMTVAEVCAVGLGALYIPFPQAVDDHQTYNCRPVVEIGGAIVIQQKELTSKAVYDKLQQLANNRDTLLSMAIKAKAFSKPDAGKKLADACAEFLV